MPARQRWMLWCVLLASASWLVLQDTDQPADAEAGVARAVERRPVESGGQVAVTDTVPGAGTPAAAGALRLMGREALISPPGAKGTAVNLFAARDWSPPQPMAVSAPAPPPTAPPLPYTYLGKKREDGVWEVFLGQGEIVSVARQGEILDGVYLVERVAPPQLVLKYQPLGQTQTLSIGEPE